MPTTHSPLLFSYLCRNIQAVDEGHSTPSMYAHPETGSTRLSNRRLHVLSKIGNKPLDYTANGTIIDWGKGIVPLLDVLEVHARTLFELCIPILLGVCEKLGGSSHDKRYRSCVVSDIVGTVGC
jgi:hypothetical protein